MQKRLLAYLICLVLILVGYFYSTTLKFGDTEPSETIARGKVLAMDEVLSESGSNQYFSEKQWLVKVQITNGDYKGQTLTTTHYYGMSPIYDFMISTGDDVILSLDVEDSVLIAANISDISRDKYLIYLLVFFLASILLIGARQGVNTILSLFVTGLAIVKILLPAILSGKSPILATIITCTGVTIITHMLITGYTRKSLAAISGTVFGIIIGGLFAKYAIVLSRVTGLNSEESRMFFFSYADGTLDSTGLLFAGIVLGSLGAVMDVAMSISSSIHEIHDTDPSLSWPQLAKKGLNVGRDIIGTMANTLILANTGMALPLMLLIMANNIPYLKFINLDMIATEIIRMLSGSIGMFLSVPFTALISAILCTKNKVK